MKLSVLFLLVVMAMVNEAVGGTMGYVQFDLTNGYNIISLQLDWDRTGTNNTPYTAFGTNMPDGTKIYLWDTTNQAFTTPSVFSAASRTWSLNYKLPLGKGLVMQLPQPWLFTTVGAIMEGYLTNAVVGSNKLSLVSFMVPIRWSLTTLQFPEIDGASVHFFEATNQTYSDAFTYFSGYGWFDPKGVVNTNGPEIAITRAFFVRNPGPDTNWVQYFVVPSSNSRDSDGSTGPSLRSLSLSTAVATLHISNPRAVPYNVEFSTDGSNWTTVATHQTAATWKGARPTSARGYYRLKSP